MDFGQDGSEHRWPVFPCVFAEVQTPGSGTSGTDRWSGFAGNLFRGFVSAK